MASLIKRGDVYHLQWYEGEKKRRKSLRTDSLQIAKLKQRWLIFCPLSKVGRIREGQPPLAI